jgi:hypothetical protein
MLRVISLVKTTIRFRALAAGGDHTGLGLFWLLRTNYDASATDLRDKVFGLLGMAAKDEDENGRPCITADYGMEVPEVYRLVAERLLAKFSTLAALSGAGVHYCQMWPLGNDYSLPSWVVNWASRQPLAFFGPAGDANSLYTTGVADGYDACLGSLYSKEAVVEGRVLKLSGFVLDEITACSELLTLDISSQLHRWQTRNIICRFWSFRFKLFLCLGLFRAAAVWRCMHSRSNIAANAEAANLFAHLLFAASIAPGFDTDIVNDVLHSLSETGRLLASIEESPLGYSPLVLGASYKAILKLASTWHALRWKNHSDVEKHAMYACHNGCAVRTRHGHVGKSLNRYAEVGDCIALVRGGQLPLVLRPTPHREWNLVGECYVHGIMNGEAFDINKCQEIRIV